MAIAIDFGTSNTVIARWNPVTQESETLNLPGLSVQQSLNPPLIPSLVYVEDATKAQVLVGQQVRDRGLDLKNDPRFFRTFKRGIGTDIQGFLPELDGQIVTFEQVGQWFLNQVITQLAPMQGGLESLVLTVPVDSFEAYRYWLGKVCQALPVEQVRILDEPTAAALGYGMADQEVILVIDFGGGTLDLSLVQLDKSVKTASKPVGFLLKFGNKSLAETSKQKVKTARVLAKAGQNLGGSDLDNWIVDYFAKTQGLTVSPLTTRLAEKVKIQLSTQTQASEVYFNDETFESYELELDRETLEGILTEHSFFERLDESMSQLLQQARRQGIEVGDINAVLLVGGTVQIPAVQTWVKQYFTPEKIRCDRPFEAIAQGALQVTQGVELKDFLYHSYGIRYWDRRNNRHSWHPIIREGQPYPMTQPVQLVLGASVENQPSIELIMGELGSDTGGTEVYFDGDRMITRRLDNDVTTVKPLNDRDGARTIAKLTPPGFPGSDRIKILFLVDEQRFLRITVEDLLTNETLLENQLVAQLS
ncbi:molecular chaperone DnaK [Fischerella thermalis WC114]|uniref:Hsp70 family protein n=1 Tax=Fischerella thermalis TaxID=372787 RepID=UPI000C804F72|nr:Hsp70 family protein [Fischerella thermalis]PLZ08609.1 molecular chaperone DnaK [Fischerella thermalis WC114]PLZ08753.1 molecular chaperone DnaK [Fischerella thermalis WC119]PLZ19450.1 molecular chaperone DnaK [Fischerella thermalis WC157]PLZ39416.1 molecular chaperone DnaK [Fischerella thermalis WC538]PLZ70800.1 molecular chaperone DnaK [Fischerella thermalis WC245]